MTDYTKLQKEYIDSVGGEAHNSAVEIIGKLENALVEIADIDHKNSQRVGYDANEFADWAKTLATSVINGQAHNSAVEIIGKLEKEVARYRAILEKIWDEDNKFFRGFVYDPHKFGIWAKNEAYKALKEGE